MKHSEFLEKEYEKFFNHIEEKDFTKNKQLVTFVKWCFDNNFLDNLSKEDLENFYEEENGIDLPLLRNKGITIGIDYWVGFDHCIIGMDPTKCFNKTKQCSVLIEFPITSKREEENIYKTLDELLDKKSKRSISWFKTAETSWCGDYLTNR